MGCATPPEAAAVLNETERVVGRAALSDQVVLLTNRPALVMIRPASGGIQRVPIGGRSGARLWGLGEAGRALYSIADFSDLVRLTVDASVVRVEQVAQPSPRVGNLLDSATGMIAQHAVDEPGTPMVWELDASGRLSGMRAPRRVSLGLARAEESLLHLLSCSVPPRVVCWLPGSNELLMLDATGLERLATLESVDPVAPAALLAKPETRAIHDAIAVDDERVVVLFDGDGSAAARIGEFGKDGSKIRELRSPVPVRMFVWADARHITAIARSGHLIEVPR